MPAALKRPAKRVVAESYPLKLLPRERRALERAAQGLGVTGQDLIRMWINVADASNREAQKAADAIQRGGMAALAEQLGVDPEALLEGDPKARKMFVERRAAKRGASKGRAGRETKTTR